MENTPGCRVNGMIVSTNEALQFNLKGCPRFVSRSRSEYTPASAAPFRRFFDLFTTFLWSEPLEVD